MLETVVVGLTMAVLVVPVASTVLCTAACPDCSFGSPGSPNTNALRLARTAERIEIHALRKGVPSNGDGLAAVFGDELPRDGWGNELLYVTPGPDGRDFDLISFGRDGKVGGTGHDEDLRYSEVY